MQLNLVKEPINRGKKVKTKVISGIIALLFILSVALITPTLIGFKAGRNIPVKGTAYSLNWSGYVAATSFTSPGAYVTGVSASWTVPIVNRPPGTGYSVVMIGIGGFFLGDETLIQVGTAQFIQGGKTSYFAWYELLPAPMEMITGTVEYPVSIEPGDAITASITFDSATNKWLIILDDSDTLYLDFSLEVTYTCSQKSAEWIVERPSAGMFGRYHLLQLANYGSVTFTEARVRIDSTWSYIFSAPAKDTITMLQGATVISAVTAEVSSTNPGRFTVTYKP